MYRKTVVILAFIFIFLVLVARSVDARGEQEPAPQAEKPAAQPTQPVQPAQPVQAPSAPESPQTGTTIAPPRLRDFTKDIKPFMAERHIAAGLECSACHGDANPKKPATTEQCLQCHTSFEELAKKTSDITPNPHRNHLIDSSDINCSFCHHGHKANENGCHKCHEALVFQRTSAP